MAVKDLIERPLGVVSVGLPTFVQALRDAGVPTVHLDWQPPAQGDRGVGMRLAEALLDPRIDAANTAALERLFAARPVLRGVGAARDVIPMLDERVLLHAGPPITWDEMGDPMRSAAVGAILYEGWAHSADEARRLASHGEVRFAPALHYGAAASVVDIISPSMPVYVVKDAVFGTVTFGALYDGEGAALRLGALNDAVLEHTHWTREVLGPALGRALEATGSIGVMSLMAQALHMGDDLGAHTEAASGLLFRRLAPALLRVGLAASDEERVLETLASNGRLFQSIARAACTAMLMAAHGVSGSSMVTAMASNGVTFGIRLSGMGDAWFAAPAPTFAAQSIDDAASDPNPYAGDGAMVEAAGLGGVALAAAPAVVRATGRSPDDAARYSRQMRHIALGTSQAFTLPALSFVGTAAGIDARLVVDSGLAPVLAGEIVPRDGGESIGIGLTRAPLACFAQAVSRLTDALREEAA